MKRVLCYGDSNTWGYQPGQGSRFPANVRWTGIVSQILKDRYVIIEDGVNGCTTVFDDYYTEYRTAKQGWDIPFVLRHLLISWSSAWVQTIQNLLEEYQSNIIL